MEDSRGNPEEPEQLREAASSSRATTEGETPPTLRSGQGYAPSSSEASQAPETPQAPEASQAPETCTPDPTS